MEIDPNYSDAHYNLAVFYLEGRPPSIELARRHYFRAIELGADPDPEIEQSLKAPAPSTVANCQARQANPRKETVAGLSSRGYEIASAMRRAAGSSDWRDRGDD